MNVLKVISEIVSPPDTTPPSHSTQDIYYTKDVEDTLNCNFDKCPVSLIDVEEAFDSLCLNRNDTTNKKPAVGYQNKTTENEVSNTQQGCRKKDVRRNVTHNYISREEVAGHCSMSSCWVIINGRVYDVTQFLKEHPGGQEIILEHAGWDASSVFADVGHSDDALELMKCYCIGVLQTQQ